MRLLIAGFLGGMMIFFWGFVAHMLLPIGEMGIKPPGNEAAVLAAMKDGLPEHGIYFLPYISGADYQDPAKLEAFSENSEQLPYAFVVYNPGGNPANADMTPNLITQLVTDMGSALLLAWMLSLSGAGFGRRVALAVAAGLFAWAMISLPYWNWYLFPLDFTLGSLLETVIGSLLASLPIAWWLGRKGG